MQERTHILCLSCANLFIGDESAPLVCLECGFHIEPARYRKLISYAEEMASFGHAYREVYEEQHRNGELEGPNTNRYFIAVGEIWAFMALAALSGVIGNVTYDVIKLAIQRIKDKASQQKAQNLLKADIEVLETEQDIQLFIDQAKDFFNQLENIDPVVRAAIMQEMEVDLLVGFRHGKYKPEDFVATEETTDTETVKAAIVKHLNNGSISEKPHANDFQGAWDTIKRSQEKDDKPKW